MHRWLMGTVFFFSIAAFAGNNASISSVEAAAEAIQPSWIAPHVRFLAADALQGRDTGTIGFEIAANYVAAQFELLGLQPAGDNGTFFQRVPLRSSRVVDGTASLTVEAAEGTKRLKFDREFFIHVSGQQDGIEASGPLLFVGYGVSDPAAHYDDYAGVDARGKIVVFLAGTPPSIPRDVRAIDSIVQRRIANARAHGALGAILLAPGNADAVRERMIRQLGATMWRDESGAAHSIHFGDAFGIVPRDEAQALFGHQPRAIQEVIKQLATGPVSFDLNARATLRARFEHRDTTTVNLAAILPGSELAGQYVVYSAHLDHDGSSEYFQGDHVLHGALDNAGGVATILAVARACAGTTHPKRSLLFLALTAEEKGLVGSDFFVHHPTVPAQSIVADINCDNFLWYFPVHDVGVLAGEYSSLQQDAEKAAKKTQIALSPAITPGPPLLVLTDHFSFLSAGIPAVSVINGEGSGDGKRTGTQVFADYMRDIHHTPKDSIDQAIDWNAATTEARFAFFLGQEIGNDRERPRMDASAFFLKAK